MLHENSYIIAVRIVHSDFHTQSINRLTDCSLYLHLYLLRNSSVYVLACDEGCHQTCSECKRDFSLEELTGLTDILFKGKLVLPFSPFIYSFLHPMCDTGKYFIDCTISCVDIFAPSLWPLKIRTESAETRVGSQERWAKTTSFLDSNVEQSWGGHDDIWRNITV